LSIIQPTRGERKKERKGMDCGVKALRNNGLELWK
jgi:hypothetical protein